MGPYNSFTLSTQSIRSERKMNQKHEVSISESEILLVSVMKGMRTMPGEGLSNNAADILLGPTDCTMSPVVIKFKPQKLTVMCNQSRLNTVLKTSKIKVVNHNKNIFPAHVTGQCWSLERAVPGRHLKRQASGLP